MENIRFEKGEDMKYHFIINPAAGKGRLADTVVEKIKNSQLAKDLDVDMYFTASGAEQSAVL